MRKYKTSTKKAVSWRVILEELISKIPNNLSIDEKEALIRVYARKLTINSDLLHKKTTTRKRTERVDDDYETDWDGLGGFDADYEF